MSDIAYTIIGVVILIWIAIFGGLALIGYTWMFVDAVLNLKTLKAQHNTSKNNADKDEKTQKDDSK